MNMWTKEQILRQLKTGDIQLKRDTSDGFVYIEDSYGEISPINQDLAKQVTRDPHVTQERWREGWNGAVDTGKVRWVHV